MVQATLNFEFYCVRTLWMAPYLTQPIIENEIIFARIAGAWKYYFWVTIIKTNECNIFFRSVLSIQFNFDSSKYIKLTNEQDQEIF